MAKTETLFLNHARQPELALREFTYRSIQLDKDQTFQIELSGYGFEVSRGLSVDDLRQLRDWCSEALGDPASPDIQQHEEVA